LQHHDREEGINTLPKQSPITYPNRDEILARVASLYYDQNKTQQEISEMIGVTRSAISRFLTEAREKGIIEITVHYPYRKVPDLETALVKTFGLKSVHVLLRGERSNEEMVHGLGVLAAEYFSSIVTPESIIGVSWGTNLYQTIQAVSPMPLPHAEVVQLVGGTGSEEASAIGPLLAPLLADKLSCACKFIHAPLITKSAEMCKALLEEPSIASVINRAKQADIALVGIGALALDINNPYRLGYISEQEVDNLVSHGAVGVVCARYYSLDGKSDCFDVNERVVGIDLDLLKAIPTKVGIAGGKAKAEAIFGALRAGYVNVLVTDEVAARLILGMVNDKS
jgi:deoxyribonucleoside regulator